MAFRKPSPLFLLMLLTSSAATAQLAGDDPEFLPPYRDELLYVHSMMNYAFDLEWQFNWERRQLADNGIRVATGSVAADSLLTDMNININADLNEQWRFQGRFDRLGLRERGQRTDDQLLLGFERSIFDSSSIYLLVNPQYEKEFFDIALGYTYYKDNREQYVRVGLFFEDFTYDTKNDLGGTSKQEQIALQWTVRLGLGNEWFLYTEGDVGNGYDRLFDDPDHSPDLARSGLAAYFANSCGRIAASHAKPRSQRPRIWWRFGAVPNIFLADNEWPTENLTYLASTRTWIESMTPAESETNNEVI